MKKSINTYSDFVVENVNMKRSKGFRYINYKKGAKYNIHTTSEVTIVFVLKGKLILSYNEFKDFPFCQSEMSLLPINADCIYEVVEDCIILVLFGNNNWDTSEQIFHEIRSDFAYTFKPMPFRGDIENFVRNTINYIQQEMKPYDINTIKERELYMLFRFYYTTKELAEFFYPILIRNREFEKFIMKNYLKAKGVKELVELSGYSTAKFNRKFKLYFNEPPYRWMLKQKSKHISKYLYDRDVPISTIIKEFDFSDASHFNRYCKTMFGYSPSKFRETI